MIWYGIIEWHRGRNGKFHKALLCKHTCIFQFKYATAQLKSLGFFSLSFYLCGSILVWFICVLPAFQHLLYPICWFWRHHEIVYECTWGIGVKIGLGDGESPREGASHSRKATTSSAAHRNVQKQILNKTRNPQIKRLWLYKFACCHTIAMIINANVESGPEMLLFRLASELKLNGKVLDSECRRLSNRTWVQSWNNLNAITMWLHCEWYGQQRRWSTRP